ncbi:hypothetical protein BC628DRAFT_440767 [Trametes gibbosa]|nr:hypothetical protein BC628DRAFT_440767 [Trametes gibbosa]
MLDTTTAGLRARHPRGERRCSCTRRAQPEPCVSPGSHVRTQGSRSQQTLPEPADPHGLPTGPARARIRSDVESTIREGRRNGFVCIAASPRVCAAPILPSSSHFPIRHHRPHAPRFCAQQMAGRGHRCPPRPPPAHAHARCPASCRSVTGVGTLLRRNMAQFSTLISLERSGHARPSLSGIHRPSSSKQPVPTTVARRVSHPSDRGARGDFYRLAFLHGARRSPLAACPACQGEAR